MTLTIFAYSSCAPGLSAGRKVNKNEANPGALFLAGSVQNARIEVGPLGVSEGGKTPSGPERDKNIHHL